MDKVTMSKVTIGELTKEQREMIKEWLQRVEPSQLVVFEKEDEQKVIDIIKQKGIAFLVPNSDYSNEHIHIDIYTNTLSKEELKMIKEVLGL